MVKVQENPVRPIKRVISPEASEIEQFTPAAGVPDAAAPIPAAAPDAEDGREGALVLESRAGAAGKGEGAVREGKEGRWAR